MSSGRRSAILTAWALVALCLVLVGLGLAGRRFGHEAGQAWVCGDTRYTRIVPVGRSVVGPPVSPPPGCLP